MPLPALLNTLRIELPIRDVMRAGVISTPQNATLRLVAETMTTHHVHAVLVVAQDGHGALGWVTSRSLLEHVARDPEMLCAGDAIDEQPVSISPGATVGDAIERMLTADVSHLIVSTLPDAPPEGVVAALDLVTVLMRQD